MEVLSPATLAHAAPKTARNEVSIRVFSPSQPLVGGIVNFQISFTLSSAQSNVTLESRLSHAGPAPATTILTPTESEHEHGYPASPVLFGAPPIGTVEGIPYSLTRNQQNHIVYRFQLGNLPAGSYHFFYNVRFSDQLPCNHSVRNEVELDAAGQHAENAQVTFPLQCATVPR
jgi:hypothetical protein